MVVVCMQCCTSPSGSFTCPLRRRRLRVCDTRIRYTHASVVRARLPCGEVETGFLRCRWSELIRSARLSDVSGSRCPLHTRRFRVLISHTLLSFPWQSYLHGMVVASACLSPASVPRVPVTRIRSTYVCIPFHVSVLLVVRLPCHFDASSLHVDVQHREHVSLGRVCFTRTMQFSVARVRYTHPHHRVCIVCRYHCQF